MRAIGEAAGFRWLLELREVVAQRVAVQVPESELADAGRVDDVRSRAEVMERRRARGMPARTAAMQRVGGELQPLVECVEDRRLAYAAVADERGHPPLHLVPQG